jgi:hypothetical protein
MAARRATGIAAAVALALVAAGCSEDRVAAPRPPTDLGAASTYEAQVIADGAAALWPLRDADGLRARDEVADLGPRETNGSVVGGTITGTTSPDGSRGAQFLRSGRIVTPVTTGLTSRDAFTLELGLRADECSNAWGRVLGTTALVKDQREGLELLHFPSQFQVSPCRFGVEFWHAGAYLGGCHPPKIPTPGRWVHWAIVYAGGTVTCYQDGRVSGRERLRAPAAFAQPGPLGLGGSGSGFQGPLDGASLSQVALYPVALTAAQVNRHAALFAQPPTPAPTARS